MRSIVKPYINSEKGKKEQIAEMFDKIASRYDFLNHFLSFGIDKLWRRRAIRLLQPLLPADLLDVATGTGDFAIEALKTGATRITGVDISEKMLAVGKNKLKALRLDHKIELIKGDSEQLEFNDASFDAVTVAFGVRNFENLSKGLSEIYRVLRPGGAICILEFSKPGIFPVKQLYNLYSYYFLPFFGQLISKDNSAYRYLPQSVGEFPDGKNFLSFMTIAGFQKTEEHRQTFGVATIYLGIK